MPSIALKKIDGTDAGKFELSDAIFAAPQNEVVVRETLNAYLANQRQGTHATKTRGMVSGGGKKPWKQKGTGRARQGSIRAAQWRGGSIIFGPSPRDYREKVNKKKRQAAIRAVLSARHESGNLIVVQNLELADLPKTARVVEFVNKLNAEGRVLFVTRDVELNFALSARNIPYVKVLTVHEINVYDLLVADTIVLTKDAVEVMQEFAQ